MSDYEYWRGKLALVAENPSDEFIKEYFSVKSIEDYYYSRAENIRCTVTENSGDNSIMDEHFYINDNLYMLVSGGKEESDDPDICNLDENLNFEMRFYNGGTNIHEMLEEGFVRLELK